MEESYEEKHVVRKWSVYFTLYYKSFLIEENEMDGRYKRYGS
jgi:hypothetical protein